MMCVGINGPDDPDLLTLKLVSKSHLKWGTLLPNLGMLALWVLELFAVYATDGRTDRQKQLLLPPSLRREHNNYSLSSYSCRKAP